MSKVLDLDEIINADDIGIAIANRWCEWDGLRSQKKEKWKEIQKFVYATDTLDTFGHQMEWSNTVTVPKICQVRDNLYAHYMAALFPKRQWWEWQAL